MRFLGFTIIVLGHIVSNACLSLELKSESFAPAGVGKDLMQAYRTLFNEGSGLADRFQVYGSNGNAPIDECTITLGDTLVNFRGLNRSETKIQKRIVPRGLAGGEIIVLQTLDISDFIKRGRPVGFASPKSRLIHDHGFIRDLPQGAASGEREAALRLIFDKCS